MDQGRTNTKESLFRKVLLGLSGALVVAMLAFAFGPPTFESHPGNGATLKGTTQVVTSYGISAFRQQMFEYGVRYKGDTLTDRCYVETIEDGKPVRRYGWGLARRVWDDGRRTIGLK
ncbi:MAG: hypothetical protein JST35_07495 [Armatimonadetes bacterium]|nr:hypothetical protein [Armatimonadota bacterium]